ncbi:putative drug exporter of the RND superfamily [Geodermatophilus pulveris]|uniref:Putative drug exporter of the RND superfamily n=1 Tax=Geodermatophilus pulveris TaxID=1564159 RepID=A0A239FXH9_9ACTN|nr:MMPL family transporter [Geodermatophilus pulveris]SNS60474.1 putative drug exporter of the RND superfamily [Geodermatophilus pulveris]
MLLTRTATWCARHRLLVVAVWAAVLVGGLAAAPALFERLDPSTGTVPGSESDRGARLLDEADADGGSISAVLDGRPADAASTAALTADLEELCGVAAVTPPLPARDGQAVALSVTFDDSPAGEAAVDDATALLRAADAPRVLVGGGVLQDREMEEQAAADLARAELFSLPVALVLLVVLFGGVVAAGIPVLVALVGVGATLLALLATSGLADVSVYAVNVVTMLGLGLAVDYALLLVARYREERSGAEPAAALERTFATAGRTVAFSGLTVAVSLAGLLLLPDPFLRSMGVAGLSVVLLDVLAALTLLPALLALLGTRIRPARAARADRGVFVGIARRVRRRPLAVALAVGALLALAAVPFLGVRYADPDARSLPVDSSSRLLVETVQSRFDTDADVDPVTVVARGPVAPAALGGYAARLRGLDGVLAVRTSADPGAPAVVELVPEGTSQGPAALRLVAQVRATDAPVPVLVTGDAARLVDHQAALAQRLPWTVAVVAVGTAVLLFLFTGSVVVPVKALVLSVLSLGASFGALVWVFQEGHLGGLVGTEALGSLSTTTPVLVLAIGFGLSMDYEVFLLGRIAEVYRRTGDNDLAVEQGLQRTGGTVTAAALLMVVVFAGFVAGGFSPVKQVGLGLALAVAVDATLVRLLLVPAAMSLMGRWNWWAPRPLRRVHARWGLHDGPRARPGAVPAPA